MTVLLDDPALDVRLALAEALASQRAGAAAHHPDARRRQGRRSRRIVAERSPLILDSELVDMAATRGGERAGRDRAAAVPVALRLRRDRRGGGRRRPASRCSAIRARACCASRSTASWSGTATAPSCALALLERDDLPLEIRQMLIGEARRCASRARRRPRMDGRRARASWSSGTRANAPPSPRPSRRPPTRCRRSSRELMQAGELTPAFLIRAVAAGQTLPLRDGARRARGCAARAGRRR